MVSFCIKCTNFWSIWMPNYFAIRLRIHYSFFNFFFLTFFIFGHSKTFILYCWYQCLTNLLMRTRLPKLHSLKNYILFVKKWNILSIKWHFMTWQLFNWDSNLYSLLRMQTRGRKPLTEAFRIYNFRMNCLSMHLPFCFVFTTVPYYS